MTKNKESELLKRRKMTREGKGVKKNR